MFRNRIKRSLSFVTMMAIMISLVMGSLGNLAYAASEDSITFVHVNDVHGRVEADEREGAIGFGRLKTKYEELKKANPNTILVNAGDTLHGTTLVNISEGESMVELMNKVGFDIMVPGNHDFNYGYERLIELKEMADFPIITANVVREDGTRDFKATEIMDIDGVKLGFFGITTEETAFKTHPDNTRGIKFEDPIEAAKKSVKALEKEGVDMVIALVHMGDEGTTLTKATDLLKAVDGIDLMIDGHSHEELNKKEGQALHVQAGEYTKNIGIVEAKFEGGKLGELKAELYPSEEGMKLESNAEIDKVIEDIKERNKPVLEVVVGETQVKLDGEREDVRTGETNLGNLIADAMLKSAEADFAFTNGGGIRASIEKGKVTVGDIVTTVPFTNTLAVVEASGAEIHKALERGVDSYPEAAGHFPQVAGLKFSFDPSREVGSRVDPADVLVGDKKLDLKATYRVVTNDFIAAGGDGYTMFENKEFVGEGGLLSDILRGYLGEVKTVNPKVEGRIKPVSVSVKDPKDITIKVDHRTMLIPESYGKPFIDGGRTLVPVRAISEGLGHKVDWNKETRTVRIDGSIKIVVGEKIITVGGVAQEMDVEAKIVDGRTYVPLKFVSEALGYEIRWDASTRTVNIARPQVEDLKPAA